MLWMTLLPEDDGSTIPQNVGIQPPHYMAQQRTPQILTNSLFVCGLKVIHHIYH
jgi:hypothetical protein